MAVKTARNTSPGSSTRWSPGELLRLANPFAAIRAATELSGAIIRLGTTLPRLLALLERWDSADGAVREVLKMRGVFDRLERLGGFLGEELLEAQHQVELLRHQLQRHEQRSEDITERLAECTRALEALAREAELTRS